MPVNQFLKIGIILLLLGCRGPVYSQSTAGSNVSKFSMMAPQLDSQRQIWVYLPQSYGSTTKAYVIIYHKNAKNLYDNSTSFSRKWQVDEILDRLKTELIVVGIKNGNDKRIDELTPYTHPEYKG